MESSVEMPQRCKNRSTNWAIPLIGLYPKECKSVYIRGTSTPMCVAPLLTTVKFWNQPRCWTEQIKKMWYIYTMEYYSVIKNEIMLFTGK
jgi:hypothetical protein